MIEWKDGAVCYALNNQWHLGDKVVDLKAGLRSLPSMIDKVDFQLNEIRIGDYIEKSELDTEQKYKDVVDVFGLFGFPLAGSYETFKFDCHDSMVISLHGNAVASKFEDSIAAKRKLTYNQIMAIGKLKRMMNEKSAVKSAPKATPEVSADISKATANKYEREISDRQGNNATVDVYDVLKAFNVTCPATQHAVKKLLCSGIRGHKDLTTDLIEAKESIVRAIELNG